MESMDKQNSGLAVTGARAGTRRDELRTRASDFIESAAERGRRVYDSAVNEAAEALSSASDTAETVGDRARSAGNAIRKSSRRAARAIHRGEASLRGADPRAMVEAAASSVRRHRVAFALAGAPVLAFITVKVMRRGNGRSI
jgi:hypothetical protein